MRKFYSKNKRISFIKYIYILLIILFDIIFFNTFYKRLGNNVYYYSRVKINELTKYYLNNTIKKYLNINTNDYIMINSVNNNIVGVDIDNEKANYLLKRIIDDLEESINKLEDGNINNYNNLEMIHGDDGIILFIPSGVVFNNIVLSNIGASIPVKINFLENINAYLDVQVDNYGINNSLVKLYIIISIEEVIEIPSNNKNYIQEYKFLLSSKLVNGEVPSIIGSSINSNSKIVK